MKKIIRQLYLAPTLRESLVLYHHCQYHRMDLLDLPGCCQGLSTLGINYCNSDSNSCLYLWQYERKWAKNDRETFKKTLCRL